jgi:enoyl-CoA hydratase
MTHESLRVSRAGAVVTLTVDRPQALNALDPTTLRALGRALDEMRDDGATRCVVVTGAGSKAFVAGADIAAMLEMSGVEGRRFARLGQAVFRRLEELPIPAIAAVNGFALGGGLELALACDFILASATARFGQPEVNLGIMPGFGGTQRLPRRIGVARARELIYSGATIDAAEALRIGLVNRVLPPEQLMEETFALASALAEKAPLALQQAKAAINAGLDTDLENGCRYEAEAFGVAFGTEDRREGMRAFLDKRPPRFAGK